MRARLANADCTLSVKYTTLRTMQWRWLLAIHPMQCSVHCCNHTCHTPARPGECNTAHNVCDLENEFHFFFFFAPSHASLQDRCVTVCGCFTRYDIMSTQAKGVCVTDIIIRYMSPFDIVVYKLVTHQAGRCHAAAHHIRPLFRPQRSASSQTPIPTPATASLPSPPPYPPAPGFKYPDPSRSYGLFGEFG